MALTKLTANASIDILNKKEVEDVLRSWSNELTRGARIRRHSILGTVTNGQILMGSNEDGPAEGMVWGITRFSVAPGPTLPAAGLSVWVNHTESPSSLLIAQVNTDVFPDARGAMLLGGDSLRIKSNASMTNGEQVTVTMSIREVPSLMAWSL